LLKDSRRFSFRRLKRFVNSAQQQGGTPMRVEKQIRFNEWLLGSTILCDSCGCLWLVPAAQKQDSYLCRQCGSEVTGNSKPMSGEQVEKRPNNY
jgi:hypothetical protein